MRGFKITRSMVGKILFSFVILICAVVFLDKGLAFSSNVYKKTFLSRRHAGKTEGDECKFIFIGDSWVEGAEAPFGKGFPEQFVEKLKDKSPSVNYSYIKACWAASNSSQAVLQLVDALINGDFEWAFILTGANNGWNVEEIDKVDKLAYELYEWPSLHNETSVNFLTKIGLPRLGRLVSLYMYSIDIRQGKNISYEYPWHIITEIYNELGVKDVSMDQVREILVKNPQKAKDYNQFFRVIKLTFGNNYDATEEFLQSNNLWKPELIMNFEKECRADELKKLSWVLAERDLRFIAKLCDENNIKVVFLTYPSPWPSFDLINNIIRKVAIEENIALVDQDRMFKKQLKLASDWEYFFNRHHPSEKGYTLMANNLNLLFKDE